MKRCVIPRAIGSILLLASAAHAEPLLIESPGDHPSYNFEAEPHMLLGFGSIRNGALGLGFRGTFKLMDPGLVRTINNTLGLTIGGDMFFFGKKDYAALFVPVQAHWSFFFSQHWSAFTELGLGFRFFDEDARVSPALNIGGRYHVTDRVSVTLRLGYPALSIGASFFL
jgi:hypothetical protein